MLLVKSTRVVSRVASRAQWSRAMGSEFSTRFFTSSSSSDDDESPMKMVMQSAMQQQQEAEAKRADSVLAKAQKIKHTKEEAKQQKKQQEQQQQEEEEQEKKKMNQQLAELDQETTVQAPEEKGLQHGRIPTFRSFSYSQIGNEAPSKANDIPEEVFEKPGYWDEDFPSDFTDGMKHEVEKLEIFKDFTMLMDRSWRKEIHPLFDGEKIKMQLNCPLEEFDDRFFVDDEKTFDTKVVMEVPMTCFKLDKRARWYVQQLAGPRVHLKTLYKPEGGKKAQVPYLKITEDKFPCRVHNHKRLCDILHDLTETAHQLSLKEQQEQATINTNTTSA